jgi:hypothetical protein
MTSGNHPQNCNTCIFGRNWKRHAFRNCYPSDEALDKGLKLDTGWGFPFSDETVSVIRARGCVSYIEREPQICTSDKTCKYRAGDGCQAERYLKCPFMVVKKSSIRGVKE